ncbi:MAG TPA: hypothetical protein VFB79_17615 [Candidatus Angelobacter sp.]|nr:hypothetical protein [Candidatus Angelobacter sp.]
MASPTLNSSYVDCTPYKVIPFQRIFPFGQLAFCALLLWPLRLRILWELHIHVPQFIIQLFSWDRYLAFGSHSSLLTLVALLNLPGSMVQLPHAIFSRSYNEWIPAGMNSQVWHAVCWPLVCMVFWWLAGRGAEALRAARYKRLLPKIGWMETIVASLMMLIMGGLFFCGIILGLAEGDKSIFTFQLIGAGAFWFLLSGLTVLARIQQYRLRKKMSASPQVEMAGVAV